MKISAIQGYNYQKHNKTNVSQVKQQTKIPAFTGRGGATVGGAVGFAVGLLATTAILASGGLLLVPASGVLAAGGSALGTVAGTVAGDAIEGKDKD